MNNEIPATVKDSIRKHMVPMIDFARKNPQGVCQSIGKRLGIYVHTASVPASSVPPGSVAGQDMVYVEWVGMSGYSHDNMSRVPAMLQAHEDERVVFAAISFADAAKI